MTTRRDVFRIALAGGGSALLSKVAKAQRRDFTQFLCPPDDRARELPDQAPSPQIAPERQFAAPLFLPPRVRPQSLFDQETRQWHPPVRPLPDAAAHQRYEEFHPQEFLVINEREFEWFFHPDAPYTKVVDDQQKGTWVWGFQSGDEPPSSPGPTYVARYGTPVLVRRHNRLPTVGHARVRFALPSTTTHLHNGHTASESDGNPQDWIDSGEFWDHHYGNFPASFDPREKLTTLWYHDHRLDFTAANVYAGLYGFYLLFDEKDSDDENDPNPEAFRLPSGEFDVPLVLQDMKFELDEQGVAQMVFDNFNTDGMIGDIQTVNRTITPHFKVKRRKYRFRLLNGGPSRFYQVFLRDPQKRTEDGEHPYFKVITGDGNFLPEPVETQSIYLGVAQRVDFVMDFSHYKPGDHVYLHNLLKQVNGAGPAIRPIEDPTDPVGRPLGFTDPETFLMRFDVEGDEVEDPSRVPDFFRPLPTIDLSEVKQRRTWNFDYDGGLWTINSRVMDPNRIDAGIEQGSAEIWTLVNSGNDWAHPIHSHFSEFLILEINGKPYHPAFIQTERNDDLTLIEYLGIPAEERPRIKVYLGGPRRDVAVLLPGDEIKLFMRWPDFLGKHVMHCHNVVHEDHAMMIRWDIVEPGRGFLEPRTALEVYGQERYEPPFPDPRPPAAPHLEEHPGNPTIQSGES